MTPQESKEVIEFRFKKIHSIRLPLSKQSNGMTGVAKLLTQARNSRRLLHDRHQLIVVVRRHWDKIFNMGGGGVFEVKKPERCTLLNPREEGIAPGKREVFRCRIQLLKN